MEHTYYYYLYYVYVYDNVHHVYIIEYIDTLQQTEIIILDYLDFGWKYLTIIP